MLEFAERLPDVRAVARGLLASGSRGSRAHWAATVLAAVALAREHATGKRGSRAVSRAVRKVGMALGNTPAVARSRWGSGGSGCGCVAVSWVWADTWSMRRVRVGLLTSLG